MQQLRYRCASTVECTWSFNARNFNSLRSCLYMYKLYHTTSGISLLLQHAEVKLRQSVNNNDIPQVWCDITCLYLSF